MINNTQFAKKMLIQKSWVVVVVFQIIIFILFAPIFLNFLGLVPNSDLNEGGKFYSLAFYYGFIFAGFLFIFSLAVFYKSLTGLLSGKYVSSPKNFFLVLIALIFAILMQLPLISDFFPKKQQTIDRDVKNAIDQLDNQLNKRF